MVDSASSSEILVSGRSQSSGTPLGKFRQFWASFVVTLGSFGLGTVLAWTSPALPQIEASKVFGDITANQKALIGSLSMLGALTSSPFSGYGVERIGRKSFMIVVAVPFIVGWCLIPLNSLNCVYVGRFITGLCAGGFSLAAPIFISEIAEDHIRGILLSLFQLMMVIGILFVYVVGTFVSWQVLAYVSCAFPAAFLALIYFVPETPRYYLANGRSEEAAESLQWYRGVSDFDSIDNELRSIQVSEDDGETMSLKQIFSRSVLQPVLICLSLMVFEQLSGFNAIIFYTVDIFNDSGTQLDPNLATIIVGIVQVAATIVSCLLVDCVGRRVLLIFSEVVMAIVLFILGTFFFFHDRNGGVPPSGFGWVPITSLIIFIIAFAQGIGPLSWTMMGEILPPNLKGACSSVATLLVWASAFLVTWSYEPLLELLKIYWCFWIYGIICVIGTVVVAIFVPETNGRSLEEIQSLFQENESPSSSNSISYGAAPQETILV